MNPIVINITIPPEMATIIIGAWIALASGIKPQKVIQIIKHLKQ